MGNSVCSFLEKQISEIGFVEPVYARNPIILEIWKYIYLQMVECSSKKSFSEKGEIFEIESCLPLRGCVYVFTIKKHSRPVKFFDGKGHITERELIQTLTNLLAKYKLDLKQDQISKKVYKVYMRKV